MATPSIRRRLIGGALRRYRTNLGYRLEDVASVLECDRSKISRIESGIRGIRPRELRELLTEYGVPDAEQEGLMQLARRQDRGWWDGYADVLVPAVLEYCSLEAAAASIMVYEPQAVPVLLQTPQYARIIAESGPGYRPADDTDLLVAACELRQQVILDGHPQVEVIIGEAAIRLQVGDPQLMAGQLDSLAASPPSVTVQILPFTAGAHAVSGSPAFSLLRFGSSPALAVVFVPTLGGGFFVDEQEDVARYLRAFTRLRAEALTAAGTIAMLQQAAGPPWD